MCGPSGGGAQIIPFNMAELAPFMPSVFNGPYNAEGAYQNAQMLAKKYPWIVQPAGEFAGAQPGQFAGATNNNQLGMMGGFGAFGYPGSGVPAAPNPNPPIPPSLPQSSMGGQYNQMGMAQNQVNGMDPATLQQIMAVLGGQSTTGQ